MYAKKVKRVKNIQELKKIRIFSTRAEINNTQKSKQ